MRKIEILDRLTGILEVAEAIQEAGEQGIIRNKTNRMLVGEIKGLRRALGGAEGEDLERPGAVRRAYTRERRG